MKNSGFVLLGAMAMVALPPAAAVAATTTSSFRCRNDLVKVGDAKSSAVLKCGEPVLKDSFCKPQRAQVANNDRKGVTGTAGGVCETVEEWTYNPGYGQFMTTLRFESGQLVSITYGDRVP